MRHLTALIISVVGIVQGVGFRPFIFRIAMKNNVKGYVKNLGGAEVEIWIEGIKENVKSFIEDLVNLKPPSAKIEELKIKEVSPKGFKRFMIMKSERGTSTVSMVPPDFGVCEYCLEEVLRKGSRWYMYPFNSCAWCGPRFTMIEKIPYDRENTAMRDFPLCEECLKEYRDPENLRRFHAQGISCPKCGPRAILLSQTGEILENNSVKAIFEAAKLIDEGFIVAVKGVGGFHIAALASDDEIVLELRRRKRRPHKPFALMVLNLRTCEELVYLDDPAKSLLKSIERPIVVLPRKDNAPVSEYVAPNLDTLGVMLPYTPLHYMLLSKTKDKFLIMTSGNPKGLPLCIDNKKALEKLSGIVEYFLVHNRRIVNRADDSVIRFTDGQPCFLRRSRGYVPTWIKLSFSMKRPVVALGAMISNTGAIGIENYVIPTQYVGDMDNLENLEFLKSAIEFLVQCYKINLKDCIIVADKHPLYPTKRLAVKLSEKYCSRLVFIQHHQAHIASVMAEFGIPPDKDVLGIAIDGIGYGDDGNIWGGEVLRVRYNSYVRVGHLNYQVLPGGDLAVKYPVRSLVGILSQVYSKEELIKLCNKLKLDRGLPRGNKELEIVIKQAYSLSQPKASSTGRFLDSVSALLNVCQVRTYEGEPAITLEVFARKGKLIDELGEEHYVNYANNTYLVDTPKLMSDVINLMESYEPRSIALTVQVLLGKCLGLIALKRAHRGDDVLIVSGGAAVNDFIIQGIKSVIRDRLKIILPRKIPPGDGGISVGQVVIASQVVDTQAS